jgi:subtilisin family serine protease
MSLSRSSGLRLAHLAVAAAFLAACSGGGGGANHPTEDGESVVGEMLIGVRAAAFGTAAVEDVIATAGDIVSRDAKGSFYRIHRHDGVSEEQAASRLGSADIVYVERNYLAHGFGVPADGAGYSASYSAKVRGELEAGWEAYGALEPANPVILAVLDTGVRATHDDLAGKLADLADARNFVTSPSTSDVTDDNGHGSALAGVAAGESNDAGVVGVSSWDGAKDPKLVTILPVKVADQNNVSNHAAIAAGINWAVDKGARVVLLSLGSASASYTLQKAVEDAYKAGVLVVAAAGNDGVAAPRYPAAYQLAGQRVLSVSSASQADLLDAAGKANFGPKVNLLAPGVGLTVPAIGGDSAYLTGQYGSSLAAAHVAGAAALLLSAYPAAAVPGTHAVGNLTVDEVRSALLAGLDSYDRPAASSVIAPSGGRLNLLKAVTAAGRIQAAASGPAGANLPGSVVLSSTSVRGGAVLTGTVVMTGEVPTVQRVVLSTTAAELGIPAFVDLPAGARSANFNVTTAAVAETKTVSVTATANGASAVGTLDLTSPGVARVAFSPASVVGGLPSTGTVTLAGPAPESFTVTLAQDDATSSTLSTTSLSIPKGASSATFTVTTVAVASAKTVQITATAPNGAAHADLAILPILGSVSFGAASVKNGSATTLVVSLNAVQATDTVVTLAWTDAAGALTGGSKPSTLTVPKGRPSASQTVTSVVGAADRAVTVHGTSGLTTTPDASLTVLSARMLSLTFPVGALVNWGDGQVSHDGHVTGTVTLDAPAPGGTTVYLTASDSIVAVPASTAVPEGGGNRATFTLTPAIAVAPTSVVISASLSPDQLSAKAATVTLKPALLSLTLSARQAAAGATLTGTVTLNGTAPIAMTVALATDDATIVPALPATVTVASGARSGTFSFVVGEISGSKVVTITATCLGVSANESFTGKPPAISSVTFAPTSGYKDFLVTGTVTLSASAFSDTTVTLASSDPAIVPVPASVKVLQDAPTATFTFTVGTVTALKPVTVTATLAGASKTGTFTAKVMQVASVVFTPTSGLPGDLVSGRVTLNAPALVDSPVALTSTDGTIVPVPTSVTVPKDATYQDFIFTVGAVTAQKAVTVTASFNGSSKIGTFTGKPITVTGLTFNPTSGSPGTSVTGTVTLSKRAPDNTLVTLSANDKTIVPGLTTVTVPKDASSADFTFTVGTVAAQKVVTVTATLNGASKNGTFTGKPTPPPTLVKVELDRSSGVPGSVVTVTATLSRNAPTATVVTLLAANTTIVPGLTRVTVPQGASSGTTTFATGPVASQTAVLITASLAGSANQTVTFTGEPPIALESLTLSPKTRAQGDQVTGTVTLSASSVGVTTVNLGSSNGAIALNLATMTVADGQKSGTFSFYVGPVPTQQVVTVTASLSGSPDRSDTFTANPASLESLVLSPKIGREDDQITGRVTLTANSIGVTTVNLESSDSAIVPNTTMTVADGSNVGDFSFRIGTAGVEKTVTITATLAGSANVQDTLAVQNYTVFVTSVGHDAAFGGLAGADAFCQARADIGIANGTLRSGNYVAFLSSASFNGRDRIADVGGYRLPDGSSVATSKEDLFKGSTAHAINVNEYGVGGVAAEVWTGSNSGGLRGTYRCDDWTTNTSDPAKRGAYGSSSATNQWVFVYQSMALCNGVRSLYCFEAPPNPLVVFVTSDANKHDGNFGGIGGADGFCQARANAGVTHGIPRGTYQAILSSGTAGAKDRLTVGGNFVLPDGSLVAANLTELFSGSIRQPIMQDELGTSIRTNSYLWSGSLSTGLPAGGDSRWYQCFDWLSALPGNTGEYGHPTATNGAWLDMGYVVGCDQGQNLYCVQQDLPHKTVFVTSLANQHDGNFGGLAGADAFCQARALAGAAHGIPQGKTWRAFLSSNSIDAKDRIKDGRFQLPSGTLVATGKPDLLDGDLQHAIDEDELGNQNVDAYVYTGTQTTGSILGSNPCNDWTSASSGSFASQPGLSSSAAADWVAYGAFGASCFDSYSLYCFQQ